MKRPAFQFYPGDWLRSTDLRSCSIGARGLWIDMMCYMHEGTPYGYLKVNQKVIHEVNLARMTGLNIDELKAYLGELEEAGVLNRDEEGCIYSKRMVKDEKSRNKRRLAGKKGGNPNLMVKPVVNQVVNQEVKHTLKHSVEDEDEEGEYLVEGGLGGDPTECVLSSCRKHLPELSPSIPLAEKWAGTILGQCNSDEFAEIVDRFFSCIRSRAPDQPRAFIHTVISDVCGFIEENQVKESNFQSRWRSMARKEAV